MTRAKFELGRALFHEPRLSGTGIQSCASCHRQERAFTDGLPLSRGATGDFTPRNSQPLANVAWQQTLTWARSDLTTLEKQAEVPLFGTHPIEIGITEANREAILLLLRSDPALLTRLQQAIRPMSRRTPILSRCIAASAQRGRELFFGERARCAQRHVSDQLGRPFQPAPFHNTGLYDLDGRGAYPADSPGLIAQTRQASDMGRFRVPSLRNVALSAPCFHDGSAATLEEVLASDAAGGRLIATGANAGDGRLNPYKSPTVQAIAEAGLSAQDQADLIAVLRSLTDEAFVRNPKLGSP